ISGICPFSAMRASLARQRRRYTELHVLRDTLTLLGEVSERSKERDWKSRGCRKVPRGFKSLPLRLSSTAILHGDAVGVAVRRARGRGTCRQGHEPLQGLLRDPWRDEARPRPVLPR